MHAIAMSVFVHGVGYIHVVVWNINTRVNLMIMIPQEILTSDTYARTPTELVFVKYCYVVMILRTKSWMNARIVAGLWQPMHVDSDATINSSLICTTSIFSLF